MSRRGKVTRKPGLTLHGPAGTKLHGPSAKEEQEQKALRRYVHEYRAALLQTSVPIFCKLIQRGQSDQTAGDMADEAVQLADMLMREVEAHYPHDVQRVEHAGAEGE